MARYFQGLRFRRFSSQLSFWKLLTRKAYWGLLIVLPVLVVILARLNFDFGTRVVFTQGVIGTYTKDNLPPQVTNLISESLVKFDKTGSPSPNLVSGWQVNSDATIFTFRLKDNLFWDDGTKMNSQDIQFNLSDVEISYPDDQSIDFKLSESFNPFPSLLTTPIFKRSSLVGIGKYKTLSTAYNRSFITIMIVDPIDKDFPLVKFIFYPDEKTAITAFELGEVQSLVGLLDYNSIKDQPSVSHKAVTNFNRLVTIFYNTQDPILSDKNFRKALSLSLPEIEGEYKAKTSIPFYSWAYNDQAKDLINDPELAKSYFSKVVKGKDENIILTTNPSLAKVGEKIIQAWRSLGVKAILRIESGIPQNFQAVLISQPIPTDPDQYSLWHSTQTKTNISKYNSQRVDKDLEDGRKINDLETRKEGYADFQKILNEDAPAAFLYFPKTNIIYRQNSGYEVERLLNIQMPNAI